MDPLKLLSSGTFSLLSSHSSRTLTLPTSLPLFYFLLSGDAKDQWINACNEVIPNNESPTEACFHAGWTAFIINYGASNKGAKGLRDFLQTAKKPTDMKLYDFKT
jgi:hypothetical protein